MLKLAAFSLAGLVLMTGLIVAHSGILPPAVASSPRAAIAAATGPTLRLTTDLGIPADPAIDVTDRLNEAIAAAGPFTTLLFEGMYRVDTTVMIRGKSTLRLQAPPGVTGVGLRRYAQLLRPTGWPRNVPFYPYVSIDNSANIELVNLSVRGPLQSRSYDPVRETAHGVDIGVATAAITLSGLDIRGVHGDFIYVGGAFLQPRPTNVLIDRVVGKISGRQSIALVSGQFITIRNSDFRQSARSAIDIEPLWAAPPGIVSDVLVEDSLFADCRNFGFGAHQVPTYRVTLRRVKFFGCMGLGKYNGNPLAWHDGLVLEDVSYDWHGLVLTEDLKGAWFMSSVRNFTVARAVWRFRKAEPGLLAGEGTVQDSKFVSDAGINPVMCVFPGVLILNSSGTGACR